MKKLLALSLALFACYSGNAQSTLSEISTIFQANCTVGCHSGPNPTGNLDLSGSGSTLRNALVEVTPTNPAAAAKGYKLIDPGYPERSFLLRKCATTSWDDRYGIEVAEGNSMPNGQASLAKEEIELIRQWVMYNAPENGTVVNSQILYSYYNGLGKAKLNPIPTPEQEGKEGFQLKMGPFFLAPYTEVEYRWKYDLQIPDSLEVYRTKAFFNDESHHFILYKFKNGQQNFPDGLRPVGFGEFGSLDLEQVTAWADPADNVLPTSTAYKWVPNTHLDLNYHILNYDADSIAAAECYLNVYTQDLGTAPIEMHSVLLPINALDALTGEGYIGQDLVIPNNGQEQVFTETFAIPFNIPDWYIWQMGSHTHARGTDYDVYRRNPNGSKGEQIYEGFYNLDYTFNQGYYNWEHSPIKVFEPLLHLDLSEGLIHEAKYVNNGPSTLHWGLTTEDEMMLISLQYTEAPLIYVSDETPEKQTHSLTVSPNPFKDELGLSYTLGKGASVRLQIYNSLGVLVSEVFNKTQDAGLHTYKLTATELGLPAGIYFITLNVDGLSNSEKIIKIN